MPYVVIKDFPNYAVDEFANVKNIRTGRVLKHLTLTKGYHGVRLYHNGNGKTLKVHRLVALNHVKGHWLFAQVNHIDGNKDNNSASNLEWCTNAENISHRDSTGLAAKFTKYDQQDMDNIIRLHKLGLTQREIAKQTGVGKSRVGVVINRHNR